MRRSICRRIRRMIVGLGLEFGLFVDFLESRGTLELLPVSLDAVAAIKESKSTLDNFIASEKSNGELPGAASSKDGSFEIEFISGAE